MPDIVSHQQTGYLAKAFDAVDLAQGIQWVLSDQTRYSGLQVNARQSAVDRFAYPVVAEQYEKLYQRVVASHSF